MTRASLAFVLAVLALPAAAQDLLIGPAVISAVTGNTIQGGMADGAVYAEFYDADGTIRAEGYSGTWSVEIDSMCFDYGADPAICYRVALSGDQVTWFLDGAAVGTGTLVTGNPNGF
jgi:hypothetical protein